MPAYLSPRTQGTDEEGRSDVEERQEQRCHDSTSAETDRNTYGSFSKKFHENAGSLLKGWIKDAFLNHSVKTPVSNLTALFTAQKSPGKQAPLRQSTSSFIISILSHLISSTNYHSNEESKLSVDNNGQRFSML